MVISNLDGLYLAIYSYVLISILFICFILSTRNTQHTSQVTDLHATARDKPRRILFSLLIATFLGTPPTLGFFYKMYLFQVFSIFG
jgi:NADH:ubiquinone oxidoreductase subunit 2 (subunit N)